jgi:hypothetical protein
VTVDETVGYATQVQKIEIDKELMGKKLITVRDWTTFGHNPGPASILLADSPSCVCYSAFRNILQSREF